MLRTFKWLDENLEKYILFLLTLVMVVVVFIQVFMRYVMENSLSWSEELARYCFIWLIYIGISYAVKHKRHISVDAALLLFKDKMKIVISIISNLLFLIFCVYVVIYGYGIASQLLAFGQTTPALQIPTGVVYLAPPVGMALAGVRLIQNIINDIRAIKNFDQSNSVSKDVDEEIRVI
ncbi:TRAP transporter small permease [Bacillus sp. es.034]|uniref:TRAP transporter small permease n=1 Tax=Bacillus sp. es.034 TaxID=1761763 RepID=UPI000BF72CEA|nr:TRAP transporter small permease [Bacillus sp. es.034]PFG05049.1 TRAP-type C4-dicarboxylate transport system permease small subunit [Bacillus sp. es.034]